MATPAPAIAVPNQSSHCAECAEPQSPNDAMTDDTSAPAEKTSPDSAWGQTTIEDFYREGMGVAGKE